MHNLLDIVNPLEHLPIIGTIYRAITGTLSAFSEKIAGDALYGGIWGAVSGAADAAFELVTGKDFGGTVLAMFTGGSRQGTAVAQAQTIPAAKPAAPANGPDVVALQASLSRNGVDNDLAQRALAAYRKSLAMPALVPAAGS